MSTTDNDLVDGWEDEDAPDPQKRRGRRAALIGLAVILALIAGVGIVVGAYLKSLDDAYEKRTTVAIQRGPSDGERPTAQKGRNFLLLGSDRRSPEEAKASGVYGQRSDVMMLVHVPEDNSSAYIVSFPRDLYIDIPGHGKDRINAALAFGGVSLTVATVENYVGVPIDHVALIDFEGIKGLVDTLGGVDVQVSTTFEGDGVQFTRGIQHMDGRTALTFVRQRYQLASGDFDRNKNQQALLKGIAQKLISRDTLTDPLKLRDAVASIAPFLTTDDGLSSTAMVDLGLSMRSVRSDDMYFLSAPHGEPYMTPGGASVVATDEPAMDVLRSALQKDDMGTYYADYAGKY